MPATDYRPVLQQVGNITLQRTRDEYGAVTGTFSDKSTPTKTQVEDLIDKALDKVAMKIGNDIPSILWDTASELVALRTAMLIETTYFAEQITEGRSPYRILKEQFDEDIADLQLSITAVEAGDDIGMGDQPMTRPRFAFPQPGITLDRPL